MLAMWTRQGLSLVLLWASTGCWASPKDCTVVRDARPVKGVIDGKDLERKALDVSLKVLAEGCGDVVDIQFVPGKPDTAVLLDQTGTVRWANFASGKTGVWFARDSKQGWEQGLLGLAFHPKFEESGRFFLHWTDKKGGLTSTVAAYDADPASPLTSEPAMKHVVYEVAQPYSNHNAGGLVFGPDGMLYVGYGDGGRANDPHGHGQNKGTALGAMLRLDVEQVPYAVPQDNPWVGEQGVLPEIWAIGLRNPWRYTFDEQGRMVVADVGQNKWEEVTYLTAGSNAGWNRREGRHCFEGDCSTDGLLDPVWEYGHAEGQSITGGYVAQEPEALRGKYVVGDFGSGRIWALTLPDRIDGDATAEALGRFGKQISTFGVDARGRIYLAGWQDGTIYRLE